MTQKYSRKQVTLKNSRRIKLVATLGPASSDYVTIKKLVEAGANVFRLNMSHGAHEDAKKRLEIIRQIETDLGVPLCVLADLQGPKLRCGVFSNAHELLVEGQKFTFDSDPTLGTNKRVYLPHPEILDALKAGSRLLINDGRIVLRVVSCSKLHAECIVEVGGEISDRKGVNVPDVVLPITALTQKDKNDIEFLKTISIDWLALSFVQRAEDVVQARELIGNHVKIVSKIEKPAAVEKFEGILEASDGVMVARGDLGVELPVQNVPPVQKRLIRACRDAGKPVIVATQMLESMISSPMPTRAEVSDVATAIYEGADAVMLSAESAAGNFPIEAVETMDAVAREVEADSSYREIIEASRTEGKSTVSDSIAAAAREISETTDIRAICCFTQSGATAMRVARERPHVPIVALTTKTQTARQLGLVWGLHCLEIQAVDRFKGAVQAAVKGVKDLALANGSEAIAVTAGIPFNTSGTTNILRVASLDEPDLQ